MLAAKGVKLDYLIRLDGLCNLASSEAVEVERCAAKLPGCHASNKKPSCKAAHQIGIGCAFNTAF